MMLIRKARMKYFLSLSKRKFGPKFNLFSEITMPTACLEILNHEKIQLKFSYYSKLLDSYLDDEIFKINSAFKEST